MDQIMKDINNTETTTEKLDEKLFNSVFKNIFLFKKLINNSYFIFDVENSIVNGSSYFEDESGKKVEINKDNNNNRHKPYSSQGRSSRYRINPSLYHPQPQQQQDQQQQQQNSSTNNNNNNNNNEIENNKDTSNSKVNKIILTKEFDRGQIGSVWSKIKIPLVNDILIKFNFEISKPVGENQGGDGFAVVFQSKDTNVKGYDGGSTIGYDSIDGHVAIEFDTYKNDDKGEPNDNHISIQKRHSGGKLSYYDDDDDDDDYDDDDDNGLSSDHKYSIASATPSSSMKDGKIHSVEIYFNKSLSSLSVTLDSIKLLDNIVVDDLKGIDKSYIGFTSSTGYFTGKHTIYNCHIIEQ